MHQDWIDVVGAGALVDAGTGGLINADLSIAAVTIMFVTYGVAGGLSAIVTDYVQESSRSFFFRFLSDPTPGRQYRGCPRTITDDSMLSLILFGKISLFFIMMMSFQALMGSLPSHSSWEYATGKAGGKASGRWG